MPDSSKLEGGLDQWGVPDPYAHKLEIEKLLSQAIGIPCEIYWCAWEPDSPVKPGEFRGEKSFQVMPADDRQYRDGMFFAWYRANCAQFYPTPAAACLSVLMAFRELASKAKGGEAS